ncbi:carbohydrate sulfotransferase 15-like [Mercenaria mercenaria]|uniref:carbohydrate sulfotransferase 15-like n=1 Tax=Mercenaria mercenaria TaxID=6596 RepID=UPI00234EA9AB|nr:carbohydrate sulfotransferase 15-like [Mercenaria mercenaria]
MVKTRWYDGYNVMALRGFKEKECFFVIDKYSETAGETSRKRNTSAVNKDLCKHNATYTPIFPYRKTKFVENIFDKDTLKFHNHFKNPCFAQTQRCKVSDGTVTEQQRLRCIPYFYIIGFPKCATTDLWDRLLLHPHIVAKHDKESHYIDDKRFNNQWSFDKYLDYFSLTADAISELCENILDRGDTQCNIITGEATANTAAVNDLWYMLPENKGCTEPRITNPDYLYNINPEMRLIALIRDPVERLWSDYLYLAKYFNYKTSPESFHQHTVDAIAIYDDCLKYFTHRGCAYNESIGSIQMRLRMGIYDIHVSDWLRIFPRKQLLIVRTEDYKKNTSVVLQRVFEHLDIDFPSKEIYEQMIMKSEKNVNIKSMDMLSETREILYKFYAQSYENVASILQDSNLVLKKPDG